MLLWLLFGLVYMPCLSAEPWRVNQAVGLPEWLSISGAHRSRFETLDEQYRANRNGGDQALLFRTVIQGELRFDSLRVVGEMIDSRSRFADSGTPLSPTVVNPVDLLQAYVAFPIDGLIQSGSQSELKLGRFTMDVGSRRLVARNRFRNTINNFTGADWQWQSEAGSQFRAFYTLPVQRLVDGNPLEDEPAFDKQDEEVSFWGLYFSPASVPWGDKAEAYVFRLEENDTPGRATSDRDITTIGFRLFRPPAKQQWDYQWESIYQFGDSRRSRTSSVDLDHRAFFQHLALGYRFDLPGSPQLIAEYDYASGDEQNSDADNNRFSTLFGARRFAYGPTSIYGAFARANISSPGVRVKFKPTQQTSAFVAFRGFWLASSDDTWTTAGIVPASGDSYVGSQIEARLRWNLLPGNLRLEFGAAHLLAGDVMDGANKNATSYAYTQAVFWF